MQIHGQCLVEQERQCNVHITQHVTIQHVHITTVAVEKQSTIYSEFVSVALVIQHAKSMYHITLLSVACMPIPYFSTLSHTQDIFRKNLQNINVCFYFLYNFCLKHFLKRIQWEIIVTVHRSSCKVPYYSSYFNQKWIFLTHFWKYPHIKFQENPSSGCHVVPCRWTDGQTWQSW